MADNVTLPGTGTVVAADDISSVWYQRVKLTDGTADSTTVIAAGNGVHGNALRVTIASDSTGQVVLAAGSAAIGKLAANSGVDIGDVDVTSLPASTNTIEVVGDVASGVAVAGNPVQIGVAAESTVPAAVSDGQVIRPWATLEGAQVMTFSRIMTPALVPTIDTAVYADGDRLGTVVTVSNAALRNGGSGIIVGAVMEDDAASNFSIEAWFFANSPTMANADNGVFDISDANMATAIFKPKIDFLSALTGTLSSNRVTPGTYLGGPCALHYTCDTDDTALYMILKARGAYDAAATDDLTIYLELLRY